MDLESILAGNADLLQTIAALNWAQTGDASMFEKIATLRVGYELYNRVSGQREIDALRNQTIAAIVKYVNDNPKAKPEDLKKEISKHIFDFAHKLEQL
ncbi:hypothetical protein DPMN_071615 [Dreissena polymorpha]|uniref:Uncharacterized protein n=1 Tax=Dreissena polymorpha TaxID=45954 RepID=A0A9D3Z4W5_DREPO|nr:hypothetical protein DPMN_071615 [Dreissena polymorpha]